MARWRRGEPQPEVGQVGIVLRSSLGGMPFAVLNTFISFAWGLEPFWTSIHAQGFTIPDLVPDMLRGSPCEIESIVDWD